MRVPLLVLLAIVGIAVGLAPLHHVNPKAKIEGKYIVMYHDNVTVAELEEDLMKVSALSGVSAEFTYRRTIKGYSAQLDARQLALIRANPKVAHVEEDQIMTIAQSCSTQSNAPWGISRISRRSLNLDYIYAYPSTGSGVNAYIIDTGIYVAHSDFGGRATFGWKASSGWSNTDGNGHGTHVASTVGGTRYGVAKQVSLIAVKVLSDSGSGSTAGVIAGVEWATDQHSSGSRPSVGNMSLGGGYSAALNSACNAASSAGLHMVVAAGNENSDACNTSPASASNVITTGSTTTNVYDERSSFSNYGSCVSIFAPGTEILGAWIGSPSASRTISGTSMASPHVCGVAALLAGQNPNWSFNTLRNRLLSVATPDLIELRCSNSACNQSPNLLLWNQCRQ